MVTSDEAKEMRRNKMVTSPSGMYLEVRLLRRSSTHHVSSTNDHDRVEARNVLTASPVSHRRLCCQERMSFRDTSGTTTMRSNEYQIAPAY